MLKLVESMPNSVHIKNVQNGRYIATNKHNLKTYGFTKESELIGLTFDDLNDFMIPYWGKTFVETMMAFDDRVKASGNVEVLRNLVFKDKRNFLRCQDLYKIPIFHEKNTGKINMIFTMMVEYTDKICQIELYEKYKSMNKNKTEALKYFVRYLGIEDFFHESLTEKEILCFEATRLLIAI